MKISTALFASIVTICCTATLVSGQLIFNDGTSQNTSFNGARKPRPQSQFTEIINIPSPIPRTGTSSFVVPNGQELVIRRVSGPSLNGNGMIIRSQSSSTPNDIFDVVYIHGENHQDLPDGTVVIDEERKLVLEGIISQGFVGVSGYLRRKTDFHPHSPTRYSEYLIIPNIANPSVSSSTVVPVGKELVILQYDHIWGGGGTGVFFASQDPLNPNDTIDMYVSVGAAHITFPDGTMVIGEGRRIHVHMISQVWTNPGHVGVLGYFRDN